MTSHSPRSEYAHSSAENKPGHARPGDDRLEVASAADRARTKRPDIVFTFAFGTWGGAGVRNFSFPEDRFVLDLLTHTRVGRVLVCDHFRSAPRKLARTLLRRSEAEFPSSDAASAHSPVRLRREHPLAVEDVKRVYAAYERSIRRAAARRGLERPVIVTANPFLAGFGDFSWAGPVTFYSWDEFACSGAPPNAERWFETTLDAYQGLRAKRRRVVAVSPQIIERIQPTGLSTVAPNGVVAAEWQRLPPPPAWFMQLPAPRLLYVGGMQSRIDVEQIKYIAEVFSEASIALVGPLIEPDHFAPLREIPNIHFHAPIPRSEVAGLIGHADVGLIPHIRNIGTEAMSPLKLYEYLAGGLPVAAVDLPGNVGVSDRVMLVPSDGDIATAVRRALSLGRDSDEHRLEFVAANTWERRFESIFDIVLAPA
jgi:teichuronic acid biosynthesis glycosyltransferase TuaH